MKYIQKAFTLSEVMLVLSVIGVISALTIPGIVQNTQDNIAKIRWKKQFSVMSQATSLVSQDNDNSLNQYLAAYGTNICPEIVKKLNATKASCMGGGANGCYSPSDPSVNKFSVKWLNGSTASYGLFDDYQFNTPDGAGVACNCNQCNAVNGHIIWIDVNGFNNPPNTVGKDFFGFKVYPEGIKPLGAAGDGYENTCSSTSSGISCSLDVLKN